MIVFCRPKVEKGGNGGDRDLSFSFNWRCQERKKMIAKKFARRFEVERKRVEEIWRSTGELL
jgi:hypothetical protein